MKITVLGCGALGQLWLTALCKQGHEVQGWLRVPQPYCSVNLVETDGSIFNESLTANDPDFLATSDLLLVTLKASVYDSCLLLAPHCLPRLPGTGAYVAVFIPRIIFPVLPHARLFIHLREEVTCNSHDSQVVAACLITVITAVPGNRGYSCPELMPAVKENGQTAVHNMTPEFPYALHSLP